MIQNMIFQYILTLFDESRDGELTVGSGIDRFDYPVEWNAQTAEELAQQCDELVGHLTELAKQTEHGRMTKAQQAVWDTYLRPFPDHGLDMEALRAIWEKEAIGQSLDAQERQLSRQYDKWYERQALTRLPWKGCAPTDLIRCARRCARLVQLNAPAPVQANEARCLAVEFVLYHCMK